MSKKQDQAQKPLQGKTILITGAARRIGLCMARSAAAAGAQIVLHYNSSKSEAEKAYEEILHSGSQACLLQANLLNLNEVETLIPRAVDLAGPLYALVNNASIFLNQPIQETSTQAWMDNISIHLTTPFQLSKSFAELLPEELTGRIINMLDWRALRPGRDHFAYSVSKAGLAALTYATAAALAPRISVNGLALGAILPPEGQKPAADLIRSVPARRWGETSEVEDAFLFLLTGPSYITGEILHIDGGRHLI